MAFAVSSGGSRQASNRAGGRHGTPNARGTSVATPSKRVTSTQSNGGSGTPRGSRPFASLVAGAKEEEGRRAARQSAIASPKSGAQTGNLRDAGASLSRRAAGTMSQPVPRAFTKVKNPTAMDGLERAEALQKCDGQTQTDLWIPLSENALRENHAALRKKSDSSSIADTRIRTCILGEGMSEDGSPVRVRMADSGPATRRNSSMSLDPATWPEIATPMMQSVCRMVEAATERNGSATLAASFSFVSPPLSPSDVTKRVEPTTGSASIKLPSSQANSPVKSRNHVTRSHTNSFLSVEERAPYDGNDGKARFGSKEEGISVSGYSGAPDRSVIYKVLEDKLAASIAECTGFRQLCADVRRRTCELSSALASIENDHTLTVVLPQSGGGRVVEVFNDVRAGLREIQTVLALTTVAPPSRCGVAGFMSDAGTDTFPPSASRRSSDEVAMDDAKLSTIPITQCQESCTEGGRKSRDIDDSSCPEATTPRIDPVPRQGSVTNVQPPPDAEKLDSPRIRSHKRSCPKSKVDRGQQTDALPPSVLAAITGVPPAQHFAMAIPASGASSPRKGGGIVPQGHLCSPPVPLSGGQSVAPSPVTPRPSMPWMYPYGAQAQLAAVQQMFRVSPATVPHASVDLWSPSASVVGGRPRSPRGSRPRVSSSPPAPLQFPSADVCTLSSPTARPKSAAVGHGNDWKVNKGVAAVDTATTTTAVPCNRRYRSQSPLSVRRQRFRRFWFLEAEEHFVVDSPRGQQKGAPTATASVFGFPPSAPSSAVNSPMARLGSCAALTPTTPNGLVLTPANSTRFAMAPRLSMGGVPLTPRAAASFGTSQAAAFAHGARPASSVCRLESV